MKARLKLVEDVAWMAESGSGHAFVVDGSPKIGGRDLGPRPMELVLLGLASCSGMDVLSILRKGRHPVRDCAVEVEAERADAIPAVFTRIHLRFRVAGPEKPAAVERAVKLSVEKYCSVARMLEPTVEISHDFEIID